MKFQPLNPWIKGNNSVTPDDFFLSQTPDLEQGVFIALDEAIDLHKADSINTGNLEDSWKANQTYILKALKLVNIKYGECSVVLDHEEREDILNHFGEPPFSSYNLYFITVYNENEEKIVYIGKTDSKDNRFKNGHKTALKLHVPQYAQYYKRVYFGTVTFLSSKKDYIPMEFITPLQEAKKYLSETEGLLIAWFNPELNIKNEKMGRMRKVNIHIHNFTNVSDFLNDYIVEGYDD